VQGVVVALELLAFVEKERERIVIRTSSKWPPFESTWRPKIRAGRRPQHHFGCWSIFALPEAPHGIAAPKNTPVDIVDSVNKEINVVLFEDTIKTRFAENGGVPIGGSPADLAKLIQNEKKKWSEVIRAAHIKPE
jgi:hypothetical protein